MTDVNYPPLRPSSHASEPTVPDDESETTRILEVIELLFFAYRDFISDPDKQLTEYGFGRAHHRVLHFLNRNPGIRVADLLDILKITKQSLGRVLRHLIEEGFVYQVEGSTDRRQRLLHLTDNGRALAFALSAPQVARIKAALAQSGPQADQRFRTVLMNMIDETEREKVKQLVMKS
ncbi:MAG: MarR family winged helix-turn-helix transcriptional regulator [Alphaproteobacteria bacterium]